MTRRNDRTHTKQLFFEVIETKRIITFYFKMYISCKKTMKCRIFNYYKMGTDYTRKKTLKGQQIFKSILKTEKWK